MPPKKKAVSVVLPVEAPRLLTTPRRDTTPSRVPTSRGSPERKRRRKVSSPRRTPGSPQRTANSTSTVTPRPTPTPAHTPRRSTTEVEVATPSMRYIDPNLCETLPVAAFATPLQEMGVVEEVVAEVEDHDQDYLGLMALHEESGHSSLRCESMKCSAARFLIDKAGQRSVVTYLAEFVVLLGSTSMSVLLPKECVKITETQRLGEDATHQATDLSISYNGTEKQKRSKRRLKTLRKRKEMIGEVSPPPPSPEDTDIQRVTIERKKVTSTAVVKPREGMPWVVALSASSVQGLDVDAETVHVVLEVRKRRADDTSEPTETLLPRVANFYGPMDARPEQVEALTIQALQILAERREEEARRYLRQLAVLKGEDIEDVHTEDPLESLRSAKTTLLAAMQSVTEEMLSRR